MQFICICFSRFLLAKAFWQLQEYTVTFTLSLQDYWELFEEAESSGASHQVNPSEALWKYPQRLGWGYHRDLRLGTGILLSISNYTLQESLCLRKVAREHPIEFGFCLAGHSLDEEGGGVTPGHHFLCAGSMPGGLLEEPAQKALMVTIHMEPELFKTFIGEETETLPEGLKSIVTEVSDAPYFEAGVCSPPMNLVLHQILKAPYRGAIRRLYLEGKVLELVALQLEQITARQRPTQKLIVLRREDIDRIHQAKDILVRQLDQPPSLTMLARQVGLNEHKLKVGFRQVFNTTVFGYLYHHRMEQARQLLEAREMTVASVAYAVGYANRSHFAAAFRRKFGMNPSCYGKDL
jgi:AraC family transcriptional regulator, transcriptional activator of the genes for pyochelin and ferripyochelin receptors